ncbi:MAG: FG-GAP repeat protein [Planctomycetes bacterium]|nr:FG-GAP repeat protein [Planctomycetota bacterium]
MSVCRHCVLFVAIAGLSSALPSQLAITTAYADPPWTDLGDAVFGIGDGDGDGVPDFVVHGMHYGPGYDEGRLQLISGATHAALGQVVAAPRTFGMAAAAAGDLNLDGGNDVLVPYNAVLRAYRGSDLALLWTSPVQQIVTACAIDDVDGDGRDDIAAIAYIGGSRLMVTLRGLNGSLITQSLPLSTATSRIVSLGDIDGTGHHSVAVADNVAAGIYHAASAQWLRDVTPATGSRYIEYIAAANAAGNGRHELLLSTDQAMFVCSPNTGQTIASYPLPYSMFTVVGDLNGDGYDDLALRDNLTRNGYTAAPSVAFASAVSGALLSDWSRTAQFSMSVMAGVGDVDGDGFGDLLLGSSNASPVGGGGDGGWQLVSGRIRPRNWIIPVTCYSGPFPPVLGMTPPTIGQTVTLVGRDCPPTAPGTLALSLQPPYPSSFGFPGCDAWFDVRNWVIVHQPAATSAWTYALPLPNAPQLAGIHVAVQAFYVPTSSPIGFDLSNAIWSRIGF